MASIQGIYIALFGRPADPEGLAFWTEMTKDGQDLSYLIGRLTTSPEYLDLAKGMTETDLINSIYQKLYDRDADPTGLAHYLGQLQSGKMTIETIAIDILNGASGADVARINAKIAAADLFTARLDQDAETEAYSGSLAEEVGRDFIDGVDENNAADQAAADAAILLLFPDDGQGENPGGGPVGGGGGGGGGGGKDFDAIGKLTLAGDIEEGGTVTASLTAKDPNGAVTYSDFTWQVLKGGVWLDAVAEGVGTVDPADSSVFDISDAQSVVGLELRAIATTTDVKGGTTDFASAGVAIVNVNDDPLAVNDVAEAEWGPVATIDVLANDTDEDGALDTLTIVSASSANATIEIEDGKLEYSSDGAFSGVDTVTYTIEDGSGVQSTATVSVTVTAVVSLSDLLQMPAVPAFYKLLVPETPESLTLSAEEFDGLGDLIAGASNEADYPAPTISLADTFANLYAIKTDIAGLDYSFTDTSDDLGDLTVDQAEFAVGGENADDYGYDIVDTAANFSGMDAAAYGNANYVTVNGTNGGDIILGLGARNGLTINGGAGDDTINVPNGIGGIADDHDHVINGGAGIDTINLSAGTGDDDIVLATSYANRDVITNFEYNYDDLVITVGSTSVTIGVGGIVGGQNGNFAEHSISPNNAGDRNASQTSGTYNLTSATQNKAVVEFTNNLSSDFDSSVTASDLFNALRADFAGESYWQGGQWRTAPAETRYVSEIQVANGWKGYLIAYADNNAYVFHADAGSNSRLVEGEVSLVATITGVAVGELSAGNFIV